MIRLNSRQVALLLAILLPGTLILSCFATAPKTDREAIRATVTDYIEGYYTGDAQRMERSLHPHYLKHTISGSGDQLKMSEWTGLQMMESVKTGGAPNLSASEKKEEITVLDVSGDIASAKLVTTHWTDYMTLTKWDNHWKIVSVVLRETD